MPARTPLRPRPRQPPQRLRRHYSRSSRRFTQAALASSRDRCRNGNRSDPRFRPARARRRRSLCKAPRRGSCTPLPSSQSTFRSLPHSPTLSRDLHRHHQLPRLSRSMSGTGRRYRHRRLVQLGLPRPHLVLYRRNRHRPPSSEQEEEALEPRQWDRRDASAGEQHG